MDPLTVAHAWGLAAPVSLREATSGTNNCTRYVDARDGSYVLRVYVNTQDPVRVRYEHAILLALQSEPLSFRVPAPLTSRAGDTLVTLTEGSLAALFPLLTGVPPDRSNPQHVRACGAALAELHAALRRVDVQVPPGLDLPTYGDLDRIHPLVPDPWSLPTALPLDAAGQARLARIFADLRADVPTLYATLPTQVCHSDFSPGNTLFVDGEISAVLDFEYAGPDLRAIDVVVGWYWSVGARWGAGDELTTIRDFLAGYTATAPLTSAEIAAMPALARLQRAAAIVHRAGRLRAGLESDSVVREQAQRLLDLDHWLTIHSAGLAVACRAA